MNVQKIADLSFEEIENVDGGILPFIVLGMVSVGLFAGGVGLGIALGNEIQSK
jgi:lactobin A/cerein 7B family class IIb bacteriocin